MSRFVLLVACLATFVSCSALRETRTPRPTVFEEAGPQLPGPPAHALRARVARVVDGDTIVLQGIDVGRVDHQTGGRYARLLEVNTPEISGGVQCFGREASNFTRRTLFGRTVLIDYDVADTDRFGRALVYVWLQDGALFNARLVAEGYAYQETVRPNVRYLELFRRLATQARGENLGLWKGC